MSGTLTISPGASPFQWGPVSIATFTLKAELVFDQSASGITLVLDGTTVSDEAEIVRVLAKAGGLSDESVKVSVMLLPSLEIACIDEPFIVVLWMVM